MKEAGSGVIAGRIRGCISATGLGYLMALMSLTVPATADAEDAQGQRTFLLVTPSDPAADHPSAGLRLHLEAVLTPYSIPVVLLEAENASLESVSRAIEEQGSFGGAWTSPDGCELTLLIPSAEPPVRVRMITPGAEDARTTRHEILATILLSELMPILDDIFGEPPRLATGDLEEDPTEDTTEVASEETNPRRRITIRPIVLAAYSPAPLEPTGSPHHGVTIAIGLNFGRHLHLYLTGEFLQPTPLDTPAGTASFSRGLSRLLLYVPIQIGPVDLGPAASVALEHWNVSDLEFIPMDEGALKRHTDPGLGVAFRIRVAAVEWLGFYLEAGIDAFFAENRVTYGEDLVLTRAPFLPHLAIGIAIQQD